MESSRNPDDHDVIYAKCAEELYCFMTDYSDDGLKSRVAREDARRCVQGLPHAIRLNQKACQQPRCYTGL